MPRMTRKSIACYGQRNANLRTLGFTTYAEYLRSPLWKRLRNDILQPSPQCRVCLDAIATEVHHTSYDIETLAGRRKKNLKPICRECHELSEVSVSKNKKRSVAQANSFQASMHGMLRRQRWEQENFHLPNKQFFKGR